MKPLIPWRWFATAYLIGAHVLFVLSVEKPKTALNATAFLALGMLLGWLAGRERREGE